jgi:hypothetical protein
MNPETRVESMLDTPLPDGGGRVALLLATQASRIFLAALRC